MVLIPPFRFGIIEEGLYRSAQPRSTNLPFLRHLNLKTLVSLTPHSLSSIDPTLPVTLSAIGCTCYHWNVSLPKENIPLTSTQVFLLLRFLLDTSLHPMLIHCLDGKLVVGIVMMSLRKIQGWALPCIFQEQARYVRGDELSNEEMKFIAKLTGELDFSAPHSLFPSLILDSFPCSTARSTSTTPFGSASSSSPSTSDHKAPTSCSSSHKEASLPSLASSSMEAVSPSEPTSLISLLEEDRTALITSSSSSSSNSSNSSSTNMSSHSFVSLSSIPSTPSSTSDLSNSIFLDHPLPFWFWGGTLPLKKHVYPSIRIKPPTGLLAQVQAQAQKEEQQQKEEKKTDLKARLLTDMFLTKKDFSHVSSYQTILSPTPSSTSNMISPGIHLRPTLLSTPNTSVSSTSSTTSSSSTSSSSPSPSSSPSAATTSSMTTTHHNNNANDHQDEDTHSFKPTYEKSSYSTTVLPPILLGPTSFPFVPPSSIPGLPGLPLSAVTILTDPSTPISLPSYGSSTSVSVTTTSIPSPLSTTLSKTLTPPPLSLPPPLPPATPPPPVLMMIEKEEESTEENATPTNLSRMVQALNLEGFLG